MAGAESRDFGSQNRQKGGGGFAPKICYGGERMNTPIGDKLFQDIPRGVANFDQNEPRDVENLLDGKK